MSFVYWVYEDKDCFVFPHNSGYVGVSEDPETRWRSVRVIKNTPKAKLLILYEGIREECRRRERQLRPHKNIGWNTAPGGAAREPNVHGRRPVNGKSENWKNWWKDSPRPQEFKRSPGPQEFEGWWKD